VFWLKSEGDNLAEVLNSAGPMDIFPRPVEQDTVSSEEVEKAANRADEKRRARVMDPMASRGLKGPASLACSGVMEENEVLLDHFIFH
jgi:hypothetical protein